MSDTGDAELEKRLAALEKGGIRGGSPKARRSPLLAFIVVALVGVGGAVLYMISGSDEETALPTATPDVFQNEGDGFGAIEAIPPPPAPETQIVVAPAVPNEPNAELLAQLAVAADFELIDGLKGLHGLGRDHSSRRLQRVDMVTNLFSKSAFQCTAGDTEAAMPSSLA